MKPNRQANGIVVALLLGMFGTIVNLCEAGPRYRATVKLLATRFETADTRSDADATFYETQELLLRSQTVLLRTQKRLGKTDDELRQELTSLNVARQGKSDVIVVTVTSPTSQFASEFATTLADEYLKFREEQETATKTFALVQLTREIEQQSQKLTAANERLRAYVKKQSPKPDAEPPELRDLRDECERIRSLHNALLTHLLKIDTASDFRTRRVTVLDSATVAPIEKP